MKIWIRSYALWCPKPASAPEEVAACTNDADGTLNYGDDTTGPVVSMQPGGYIASRPNGTKGPWEQKATKPGANLFAYAVDGVTHLVPYRER